MQMTPDQASREMADLVERASAGEPQRIDGRHPCVVISLDEYERLTGRRNVPHLGSWLVDNAPRIGDIDLPPRDKDRPVPFDDWAVEDAEG
jgi:hypothetical protein